jgi:hypothetical protein
VREEDHTVKAKREEKETVREEDALNPSPKAPVKFHFKIDGRHEKVLNRTDRNGNVDVASREGWNPFHGLIYFFSTINYARKLLSIPTVKLCFK